MQWLPLRGTFQQGKEALKLIGVELAVLLPVEISSHRR
jgi:hypothetical protein